MTEWQILISDPIAEEGIALLAAHAKVLEGPPDKHLGQIDGLIVRSGTRVTRERLHAGSPRLKVIGRAGVGVDNIDLESARELSVRVVNAPDATSIAVAEHTLAMMLSLCRHIPEAVVRMRAGGWPKIDLIGSELHNKVLGIIGLGRIGSEVARRASAFGMQVISFDPYLSEEEQSLRGGETSSLAALLKTADYVSLHLPLTDETAGLLDRTALSEMKPGSTIISMARGGVLDEIALLEALQQGHIAGAALDVFSEEPPRNHELVNHPKVITTPHIAGQTEEAQRRVAEDIAGEVLAALEGKPLQWVVV